MYISKDNAVFADRSAVTFMRHYYEVQSSATQDKATSAQFILWKARNKKEEAGITETTQLRQTTNALLDTT
jgi:hypothetical protein